MSFLINPYMFAAAGCSGNIISTSGLKAYFKFEGSVLDQSGNVYNGTATSLTYTASGKYGSGGTFNGSSTMVTMSNQNYDIATAQTIMAWIKTSTAGGQILSMDTVASNRCWEFGLNGGTGTLYVVRFNSAQSIVANFSTSTSVSDGNWHHVAWTFNTGAGQGTIIYIDGVSAATDSNTTATRNVTNQPLIGAFNGGAAYFTGTIDEVSIWNRTLTPTEIATVYNSTCPLISPNSGSLLINNNLNAYYKFEGNTNDSSGVGNNASSTGLTYTSSGKFGSGGTFNGSSTIVMSNSSITSTSTGTVMLWFNMSSLGNKQLIDGDTATIGPNIQVFGPSAPYKIYAGLKDGTGGWATSTTSVSTSTWYHVALTWNGTNIKIYVNGALEATTANTNVPGNYKLKIGIDHSNSAASYFPGTIDEVSSWSRELSADEILTVYNSTSPLIS